MLSAFVPMSLHKGVKGKSQVLLHHWARTSGFELLREEQSATYPVMTAGPILRSERAGRPRCIKEPCSVS